eukprot:Gb_00869 [translate_table: standard]
MGRTVSALCLLLVADFFWCYIILALAETQFEANDKNGSSINRPRQHRSVVADDGRSTASWPDKASRDRMMGPGFAYTRNRASIRSINRHETMGKAYKNAKSDAGAAKVECTAEYWRSRKEKWPRMVPVLSTVAKVFGSRAMEAYGPQLTLLDAMVMEESDGYASLLKQSSAALVNSYSREGFPYSAWRVKTLVIQSLVSQDAAAAQAHQFLLANQACS